ncbi:MAG: bifunctional phosphoribosylaminoimidazolecarboxamide formyltransferase/IMP cyclohydrolase [Gammaproteobacteria bacterium]|nr:bifunctional phosphoribosylaminoimidazolecarboxamide formyltransferase/IMP cyclohydrolase [Gammaproteobacteria bacterium]
MSTVPIRRALISVSDKTGVAELAQDLADHGVEILSTGGTARLLADHGIPVREVSAYTGFPEMMDGRLKTLHPRVHGGLLGRIGSDDEAMAAQGIEAIDLLVVNLYPFARTVADPQCTREQAIENIDIGGPAMLRAAAKNHQRVTVLSDPQDYPLLRGCLATGVDAATRARLAERTFARTAAYDSAIAAWLSRGDDGLPQYFGLQVERVQQLRYGENPHQRAGFYRDRDPGPGTLAGSRQLQGKELSFNNIADADAALQCVRQFQRPACVIVKHANPCGVAVADDLTAAYDRAFATDPTSAFGGILAFNRALDGHTARALVERQFVEVVIAPEVEEDALAALSEKANLRVLACGSLAEARNSLDLRRISGGLLVQDADLAPLDRSQLKVVSRRRPDDGEMQDLLFAWRVCHFVKSNAIVYVRNGQTLGVGAGQMSRVDSARIAAMKAADAGLDLRDSAVASDAFFPFRDGLEVLAAAGARCVIQPGGSLRDDEVIKAADEHNIAMVFTGVRHFRH